MEKDNQERQFSGVNERLALIIKQLGYTQKAFGELLNVKQRTMHNYLHIDQLPNPDMLYSLNTKYGIDINWLFTGKGKMFLEEPKNKPLQREEKNLVRYYRLMNDDTKQATMRCVKAIFDKK